MRTASAACSRFSITGFHDAKSSPIPFVCWCRGRSLETWPQGVSRESPRRKSGYASVGLGRLRTNQLAPALQKTHNSERVGLVTGSPAKAAQWQKKYGLREKNTYNSRNFDQVAENPEIDVI
ncbi:MAG: hypothetical protein GY768_12225 [Planctomycetaceae bacterium]|nr:hypothetical protein [Planctomycetaceae bacterium]